MNPSISMPGGRKLETFLVCSDGKCGRCVRCDYMAKSKALVEDNINLVAATDKGLKEHQALIVILKNSLQTIHDGIVDHDHQAGHAAMKRALQEILDMTPESAYKALTAEQPADAPGEPDATAADPE